jgi:hypothetical protein
MLTVFLSDISIKPFSYSQPPACFLYPATPKQQENRDIQE